MTRVTENSTAASVQYALNKSKAKLEDLQRKGTGLRKVGRPSDNPMSNIEALQIDSSTSNNKQFLKNAEYALVNLNVIDKSLEQVTNILQRAKETAIAQSSDLYGPHIRKNISNEVIQMRNELLAVANKRIGPRYIFSGHKGLTRPFDVEGKYYGDNGRVNVEISKGFFVPINLTGAEIFAPMNRVSGGVQRSLASDRSGLFGKFDTFIGALENNDAETIRSLLEKFDHDLERTITLRTRIGSLIQSIEQSKETLESDNIAHAERRGRIIDADIAELFSDITKQQDILKASYQASRTMLNQNLLDFMR